MLYAASSAFYRAGQLTHGRPVRPQASQESSFHGERGAVADGPGVGEVGALGVREVSDMVLVGEGDVAPEGVEIHAEEDLEPIKTYARDANAGGDRRTPHHASAIPMLVR